MVAHGCWRHIRKHSVKHLLAEINSKDITHAHVGVRRQADGHGLEVVAKNTALRAHGFGGVLKPTSRCRTQIQHLRAAAQQIFPAQHLPTWIFDVELLLLAKQLRVPVAEVPIEWHEVAGSKLNVVTASLQMLRDLLIVRANHLLGRWTAGPVGRPKTE